MGDNQSREESELDGGRRNSHRKTRKFQRGSSEEGQRVKISEG